MLIATSRLRALLSANGRRFYAAGDADDAIASKYEVLLAALSG